MSRELFNWRKRFQTSLLDDASLFRRFQTPFAKNFDQICGIAPRNAARVGYDSHTEIRLAIALANSEHVTLFHCVRRLRGPAVKQDKARVAKPLS